MQENPQTEAPATERPSKIMDVITQPTAATAPQKPVAVAAPDPELMGEATVAPAPEPELAKPAAEGTADSDDNQIATEKTPVSAPQKPVRTSTTPVGVIVVAIIMFLVLAGIALAMYMQGF